MRLISNWYRRVQEAGNSPSIKVVWSVYEKTDHNTDRPIARNICLCCSFSSRPQTALVTFESYFILVILAAFRDLIFTDRSPPLGRIFYFMVGDGQVKTKLETLCKELQKQQKAIAAENMRIVEAESENRKKLQANFNETIEDIKKKMEVEGEVRIL